MPDAAVFDWMATQATARRQPPGPSNVCCGTPPPQGHRSALLRAAIADASEALTADQLQKRTGVPAKLISGLLKHDIGVGRVTCTPTGDIRRVRYGRGDSDGGNVARAIRLLEARGYSVIAPPEDVR